jgi:isochorismate hydrolase
MRDYVILLLLSACTLFSCNEDPKNTQQYAQMERILNLHDEVMPEMSTISRLISALESATQADSTQVVLGESVEELKEANQAMMQWMMDFSEAFTTAEIMGKELIPQEKQSLLTQYEASATALKQKMLGAIKRADVLEREL